MDAAPLVALGVVVIGILAGERTGNAVATVALVAGIGGVAGAVLVRGRLRAVIALAALAAVALAVSARAYDGVAHSPLSTAIATRAPATVQGVAVSDSGGAQFSATVLVRVGVGGGQHRTILAAASGNDAARLRVLQAGDRVTLSGRLGQLTGFGADRARVRHAVGRLDRAQLLALGPPRGLLAIANPLRDEVLRGTESLPPTTRALLSGFLLGDTRGIPSDVVDTYRDSGLSHLLAVSGENVAFVLALAGPLLRRLPLGARTALALAIILVFAAMTRFEPSVLRASVMASVALLAAFAGRPASRVRVLSYAVVVLLLVDPFLLHSVGFLLSCGASAGIALAEPPIARHLPGPRALREPLAVSIAAQLGVMPVLLVASRTFPVVTPLTNLAAAPAAELLGVYGLIASAVAGVAPRLGPLLQVPTELLVGWVTAVAQAGAAVGVSLDRRGALGCTAIGAAIASVACRRGWEAERTPIAEGPSRE